MFVFIPTHVATKRLYIEGVDGMFIYPRFGVWAFGWENMEPNQLKEPGFGQIHLKFADLWLGSWSFVKGTVAAHWPKHMWMQMARSAFLERGMPCVPVRALYEFIIMCTCMQCLCSHSFMCVCVGDSFPISLATTKCLSPGLWLEVPQDLGLPDSNLGAVRQHASTCS